MSLACMGWFNDTVAVLFLLITQQLEQAFTSLSYYVRVLNCLSAVVQCMLLGSVFLYNNTSPTVCWEKISLEVL
jgi:hypothetical protein